MKAEMSKKSQYWIIERIVHKKISILYRKDCSYNSWTKSTYNIKAFVTFECCPRQSGCCDIQGIVDYLVEVWSQRQCGNVFIHFNNLRALASSWGPQSAAGGKDKHQRQNKKKMKFLQTDRTVRHQRYGPRKINKLSLLLHFAKCIGSKFASNVAFWDTISPFCWCPSCPPVVDTVRGKGANFCSGVCECGPGRMELVGAPPGGAVTYVGSGDEATSWIGPPGSFDNVNDSNNIDYTKKKVKICIVLLGCFDKVVVVAFYADHHIVIMIIMSGKPVFIAPKSDHCLALVSHFSCWDFRVQK